MKPRPALGFSRDTYPQQPADDADAILVPWADKPAVYVLEGAELARKP